MKEYLMEKYGPGVPILIKDLEIPGYTKNAIRQQFHNLVKKGSLNYYGKGVYYLGDKPLMFNDVLRGKYIAKGDEIIGYWGGLSLQNMLGLTTQVPMKPQVVSNKASNAVRHMEWDKFRYTIIKPRTKVTKKNFRILQFLDLITDIDTFGDEAANKVIDFAIKAGVTKDSIDDNLKYYPLKTYKNLIDRGIYDKISSRKQ